MRSRLKIRSHLVEEMVSSSLARDREVCGLLLGIVDDEGFKVIELYEAKNVSLMGQAYFEVDPRGVYEAYEYAEKIGLEVVGIYHSHPGPPIPSAADLDGMKNWPIVWLIISSIDGSMAAYVIEDGRVKKLEVLLE